MGALKAASTVSAAERAPIVAVASGKGGVGKTWLSVSLACAFAQKARRTLLVDCDLGLANVDVQLGLRPQADLSSVINGWVEFEAAVTPVLGGPGRRHGFDLIAGHSGSVLLGGLRMEEVHRIAQSVTQFAPLYDRVLMDLGAGLDPTVMRFARSADRVLVVTNDEPTALTDAYAFLKVLRLGGRDIEPFVAVNLSESRQSGKRIYDQLAKACELYLGFRPTFAGSVTRDPRVSDSIRAQTPLPVRHPQSQAYEDVLRIAEALSV